MGKARIGDWKKKWEKWNKIFCSSELIVSQKKTCMRWKAAMKIGSQALTSICDKTFFSHGMKTATQPAVELGNAVSLIDLWESYTLSHDTYWSENLKLVSHCRSASNLIWRRQKSLVLALLTRNASSLERWRNKHCTLLKQGTQWMARCTETRPRSVHAFLANKLQQSYSDDCDLTLDTKEILSARKHFAITVFRFVEGNIVATALPFSFQARLCDFLLSAVLSVAEVNIFFWSDSNAT